MAGIKSLAVRGIRSFGPEEYDEQRITFEKPLTLILGQNGCGKTTIIECLRYAITGQMPPGSRNECFVHDAKVNRSTEVLGQVRVKIINAKDKLLEVSRSMRVTAYKNKKSKFQTLDSFLSVVDEKGKTKDISSRCADLDFVMHEELGVSKAILNSVIFCHQEDSSWPLEEGKKVKDRFDEIFEADKYSECFDRLRKIAKEYSVKIKLLEQEVSFLTEKKEALNKKKLKMVNTESSISEAELRVAELAKELKPITEKLTAIETLQKNLVSIEFKKDKIKTKLEHNETQKQELEKAIQTLFEGTIPELQAQIKNYGTTGKNKQEEINDSYTKIFNFNSEEEKIANEKTANEVKYDRYVTSESQNQEKMAKRNTMLMDVAKLAEIVLDKVETEEDAVKGVFEISKKIKDLHKQMKEQKALADAKEKKLQKIIDESRDALSRHKQKISNKETEIQTVKKEITKFEKQVNDANKSKDKLNVWEQKLKTAEDEYIQLEKDVNVEECQNEINSDEKTMEAYEQELEHLNDKITNLQKQTAKLKEKEIAEESLKQKEKQLTVLTNKHKSDLTKLLGSMPEKDFALAVTKVECEVQTEVESLNKKITENQNKITRLEAERTHIRTQLCERRAELTVAEDKMHSACGALSYDDALTKLTTSVEKLQDEQNILQSSMFIIAKYKGQLQDNNCCPLCNRGFDSGTEVTELISQLTTQVLNVPSKLAKVTEELQRASATKDELLGLRAVSDQVARLKDKNIPVLETRLAKVEKEIATLTESSEELSMLVAEPEVRLGTAAALRGDMPLLDRFSGEFKLALRALEVIKDKCADLVSDMSLDDATAKQAELRQKITALRAHIKSTQTKINAHNKKLQKTAEKKNKLKEELLNIQKKVQDLCNLQEAQKQLDSKRKTFLVELNELEEAIAPLEQALKEKDNDKIEAVKKLRGEIEISNAYISKVVSAFDKVKSIESEIKQHKEKNIQKDMDKIKEANVKLTERHKQVVVDRNSLTKRLDTLKDELAKQEIYKRNLEDNLKLRHAVKEIETCQKELAAINAKLSGMNMDSIKEKPALISRETELLREKAQTEGQLSILLKTLSVSKMELKKKHNKGIEHRYREKYYELHVLRAVSNDVREYGDALERSLMEYHRSKMENINLIIREMWRKIYRGNDIDYIEIRTEGGVATGSKRRKYDYRVIQSKNGVEIDMRGRCSAGQKVLACLIIRLALAETFSSRFGILALDEPTTNLDQENIKSLCSALGEIVQQRMSQKNFMFVIITHDKDFIDSLGNVDKVTHYYEVSRNVEGKSRVKKIRFT